MRNPTVDELIQSPGKELDVLKEAIKQEMHCAMPGIVKSYDPDTQSATIQLAIRNRKGTANIEPPMLTDVPVYLPPPLVKTGDECLVVFADMCIDGWFYNGGIGNPISLRRHDLSDGFAFVGFRSKQEASANGPKTLLDTFYPVGCIYSATVSTSPQGLFGGSWTALQTGPSVYSWTRTA